MYSVGLASNLFGLRIATRDRELPKGDARELGDGNMLSDYRQPNICDGHVRGPFSSRPEEVGEPYLGLQSVGIAGVLTESLYAPSFMRPLCPCPCQNVAGASFA